MPEAGGGSNNDLYGNPSNVETTAAAYPLPDDHKHFGMWLRRVLLCYCRPNHATESHQTAAAHHGSGNESTNGRLTTILFPKSPWSSSWRRKAEASSKDRSLKAKLTTAIMERLEYAFGERCRHLEANYSPEQRAALDTSLWVLRLLEAATLDLEIKLTAMCKGFASNVGVGIGSTHSRYADDRDWYLNFTFIELCDLFCALHFVSALVAIPTATTHTATAATARRRRLFSRIDDGSAHYFEPVRSQLSSLSRLNEECAKDTLHFLWTATENQLLALESEMCRGIYLHLKVVEVLWGWALVLVLQQTRTTQGPHSTPFVPAAQQLATPSMQAIASLRTDLQRGLDDSHVLVLQSLERVLEAFAPRSGARSVHEVAQFLRQPESFRYQVVLAALIHHLRFCRLDAFNNYPSNAIQTLAGVLTPVQLSLLESLTQATLHTTPLPRQPVSQGSTDVAAGGTLPGTVAGVEGPVDPLPFIGLRNLGNTCYANATLQALHRCIGFRNGTIRGVLAELRPGGKIWRMLQGGFADGSNGSGGYGLPVLFSLLLAEMGFHHSPSPSIPRQRIAAGGTRAAAISPEAFIRCLPVPFRGGGQQDAAEFSKSLFAILLSVISPTATDEPNSARRPDDESDREVRGAADAIYKYFGSQTSTTIHCQRCGVCSTRMQTEWDLPLALPVQPSSASVPAGELPKGTGSDAVDLVIQADGTCAPRVAEPITLDGGTLAPVKLQNLIGNTIGPESREFLRDAEQYACDRCGIKTDATRTVRVVDTTGVRSEAHQPADPNHANTETPPTTASPPYLIVQLNRFHFNRTTLNREKIFTPTDVPLRVHLPTTPIDKPASGMDHCKPENFRMVPYDLIAVVVHSGSTLTSGHYYAFVSEPAPAASNNSNNDGNTSESLNPPALQTWYCCNDSEVSVHCTTPSPSNPAAETQSLNTSRWGHRDETPYLFFYQKSKLGSIQPHDGTAAPAAAPVASSDAVEEDGDLTGPPPEVPVVIQSYLAGQVARRSTERVSSHESGQISSSNFKGYDGKNNKTKNNGGAADGWNHYYGNGGDDQDPGDPDLGAGTGMGFGSAAVTGGRMVM